MKRSTCRRPALWRADRGTPRQRAEASYRAKPHGFTLVELLVVIVVIAIIASVAIPSFQNMIRTNAVASQNNELVALIQFARSEAIRSQMPVTVAIGNPGTATWFAEVGDLRRTSNDRVWLTADVASLTFNNRGYLALPDDPDNLDVWNWDGATLNLRHIDCALPQQHRELTIRSTGQIEGGSANGC